MAFRAIGNFRSGGHKHAYGIADVKLTRWPVGKFAMESAQTDIGFHDKECILPTKEFPSLDALAVQTLPFTVRMASRDDLTDVCRLRSLAYGKHIPELGSQLSEPEESDFELGCEVMVARSKFDDTLLGTLRTHANAFKPLPLQASVQLPDHYRKARLIETTRLCVKGNQLSSLVRNSLFKGLFHYCQTLNINWMIAAGRRPVDRIYDALLFSDVGETGKFYPMGHAGGALHRVMSFSPSHAKKNWEHCKHPLYNFVFETKHPDINVRTPREIHFTHLSDI